MKIFLAALLISSLAHALPATLNFQARIRIQDGQVLEHTDVNYFFEYTSPDGSCVLYQEAYDHQNMYGSGGLVSFQLGVGIDNPTTGYRQIFTSAAGLKETFKNSGTYTCKDGSTYTPGINDIRKLAVKFAYTGSGGWNEVAGIKINSVPFAMYATEAQNSDNLGGIAAALYTKFADFSTCTGGQVLTYNGTTFSCVSPGSSTNFSGVLAGDVSGTQAATVVDTVGGKTAAQVSTSVDDTTNATNAATASRIVKRDGSGNASFNTAQANNFSGRNLLLFEATDTNHVAVQAPSTFTAGDYVLTLPQNAGTAGYVLSTNGSGVTSWISPTTGNVTSVGASAPLVSTGGQTPTLSIPAATASVDGYLSAADFTTFNSKVSSQWTTNGSDIYYNTGKVGIGNATPAYTLDVVATDAVIRARGTVSNGIVMAEAPGGGSIALESVNNNFQRVTSFQGSDIRLGNSTDGDLLTVTGSTGVAATGVGHVGIGTTAPNAKLEVRGASSSSSVPIVGLNAGGISHLYMGVNDALPGGEYAWVQSHGTTPLKINELGNNTIINQNTGNVGVGTAIPTQALQVHGDNGYPAVSGTSQTAAFRVGAKTSQRVLDFGVDGATSTAWMQSTTMNNLGHLNPLAINPNGGLVAIGKQAPSYALDVVGDVNVTGNFKINGVNIAAGTVSSVGASAPILSSGGANPTISMPAATAAVDGYLSAADFTIFNNKVSSQWTNNAADIYFSSGRVGIGTSTPTQALDIVGNINIDPGSQILSNGASILRESGASTYIANGAIQATNTGGGLTLFVQGNNGSVGIGNAAPAYKLDVAGDVNVTGNFKINGVNIAAGTVTSVGASAPLISSGGATPSISMPAATTSADGYLTATDWNTFNSKLGTASAFAGDVTGTSGATVVEKIRGTNVAITGLASGNFMKYDGTNWVNSTPVIGDVTGLTTALSNKLDVANMPASCNASSTLTFASPSGAWSCTPIAGLNASVITAGTIDAARLPASANYWQPYGGGIAYSGGDIYLDNTKGMYWGANTDGANIRFESASDAVGASKLILETQDNSDEEIVFRQTGIDRLNIGVNGFVGVGVTAPTQKLDVAGNGLFTTTPAGGVSIRAEAGTPNDPGDLMFLNNDNSVRARIHSMNGAPGQLRFSVDEVDRMTILTNGRVGVGTAAPTALLEVKDTAATVKVTSSDGFSPTFVNTNLNGMFSSKFGTEGIGGTTFTDSLSFASIIGSVDAVPLQMATNGAVKATILANGNVGIGTVAPGSKLEVHGDITLGSSAGSDTATYGNQIRFMGASGNSDDQWIARYNETPNVTDLRVNLGDDTGGAGADKFSIGATISNVYHTAMTVLSNGQVGIGTRNPAAALDVVGQIRPSMGTPLVNPAGNNVDFATGNTQYVTISSCPGDATTVNLFSMLEGGSYSLIITTPANCLVDFSGISHPIGGSGGVTVTGFKYPAGQKFSSTGNPVVYSFLRANNFVFVAQVVDFQ